MGLLRKALRRLRRVKSESKLEAKSAQIHDIRLLKAGPEPTGERVDVKAEYEPQSPRSIISRNHVSALQGKIDCFPDLASSTFRDHKYQDVLYIPRGTVNLQWRKNDKAALTEFHVVDRLAPQYDDMDVNVVLGGADVNARLLNDCASTCPIFPTKLSKAQKEKQREEQKRNQQKVDKAVEEEAAAERRQRDAQRRDAEWQARLRQH